MFELNWLGMGCSEGAAHTQPIQLKYPVNQSLSVRVDYDIICMSSVKNVSR
jgi:hypothetical protein